ADERSKALFTFSTSIAAKKPLAPSRSARSRATPPARRTLEPRTERWSSPQARRSLPRCRCPCLSLRRSPCPASPVPVACSLGVNALTGSNPHPSAITTRPPSAPLSLYRHAFFIVTHSPTKPQPTHHHSLIV